MLLGFNLFFASILDRGPKFLPLMAIEYLGSSAGTSLDSDPLERRLQRPNANLVQSPTSTKLLVISASVRTTKRSWAPFTIVT